MTLASLRRRYFLSWFIFCPQTPKAVGGAAVCFCSYLVRRLLMAKLVAALLSVLIRGEGGAGNNNISIRLPVSKMLALLSI
jgi:hypothetical protein